MTKCELCKLPARLYCESDEANLCTRCDAMVHEANFLVARHSRTLLCKTCQCRTPWAASGARLGNTTTECGKCVVGEEKEVFTEVEEEEVIWGSGEDCDEEGENEVVPWSYSPISLSLSRTPPPAARSSSCDESSSSSSVRSRQRVSFKRMRECGVNQHRFTCRRCSATKQEPQL